MLGNLAGTEWSMCGKFALAMILLSVPAMPLPAQMFDLEKDRVPMAVLDGPTKFHPGDDPGGKLGWASPNYDDSSWTLMNSDKGWNVQGYENLTGFAWYRFYVALPPQHRRLALYIPGIDTSYEVYANGEKIGQMGGLPPHPMIQARTREVFPLPEKLAGSAVIALRVWRSPFFVGFSDAGLAGPPRIGDADLLNYWQTAQFKFFFWSNSAAYFFALVEILTGLGCIALFLLRRNEREYFWFGACQIFNACSGILFANLSIYKVPLVILDFAINSLGFAGQFCFLAFIYLMLRRRGGTWYWIAVTSVALNELLQIINDLDFGEIPITFDSLVTAVFTVPYSAAIIVLLIRGARRREPDSQLLLIPISLGFLAQFVGNLSWSLDSSGRFPAVSGFRGWWTDITEWPFPLSVENISNTVMQLAIFGIMLLRYARSRRDEERLKGELEAARVVQQVLVPAEQPVIPGFVIASIYKPAGQVGGDFFQIVPTPAGGALVVIGDVSGKGMPAAMTVSLLVGTFRTLAHYTQNPGEILAAMNQRMLARSNGGFTTCLALRVDPDGVLTGSNAGHLTPYLNGTELSMENGLPLGLVSESVYPEVTVQVPHDAQLTLLTDGVVEARSKTGELFGFERTAALSTAPAEAIAQAAEQFGQEDDITVLSLTRQATVHKLTTNAGPVEPSLATNG